MSFINKIKFTIFNIRDSIKRFPITIFISTLLAISLINLNENNLWGMDSRIIEKINMILGLGIPMSLCIGLLLERFYENSKKMKILLYTVGTIILVLYYFLFLNDGYELMSMVRYIGTMIFLILGFLFIPRLRNDENYEYYIMDIWSGFSLTFIYSFVLYIGFSIIFFTIDSLFDINIKWEFYYYMFLLVFFVFAISLFLSKLPSIGEEYTNVEYTKPLKALLLYIVIPLISVYTLILYIYFGKILITREWPRGLVSHLVLWYSTVSVGVIFLISPILDENKIARMFKLIFPKVILPVLLMMFMSIYQRIAQYGITENRYYVVVLGLWVLGVMLYFSFKKSLKNIIIPISIGIVIFISLYGPFSSFTISKISQNKRFESILDRNNMIVEGEINKNIEISKNDQKEINSIIRYFSRNHHIDKIKSLPKGFDTNGMEDLFGFKYIPYESYYGNNEYFHYGIYDSEDFVDIKGFDYYINMNSWSQNKKNIENISLQYNNDDNSLIITSEDSLLFKQDIKEFAKEVYNKGNLEGKEKRSLNYMDMTFNSSFRSDLHNIDLKFIFNNMNGRIDEEENLILESVEFILLIGIK